MTNPPSPARLQRAPRSIWCWVAAPTISCRRRKVDIAGTSAICSWKFAETVLISCARRRNSRRSRTGGGQNFSVCLAMPNWLTQIRSKREANSRAFQTWSGARLNSFNTIASGYFLVVDAGLMRKAAEQNNGEHTLAETVELDRAVAVARRYAGGKSAIFVCGDVGDRGIELERVSVSERPRHCGARLEFRRRSLVLVGDRTQWRRDTMARQSSPASQEPPATPPLRLARTTAGTSRLLCPVGARIQWKMSSFSGPGPAQRLCTARWTTPRYFRIIRDNSLSGSRVARRQRSGGKQKPVDRLDAEDGLSENEWSLIR